MKAIILAAGRGSRMGVKTTARPKCLVTLHDRSLLEMALAALEKAGFAQADIGIVTGYLAETIKAPGLRYFYNDRWAETNMLCSLMRSEEWLATEKTVVCYSDIVFHPEAIRRLRETSHDIALTYYTDFRRLWEMRFADPLGDLESFEVNEEGRVLAIGGPVTDITTVQGQFMGLLSFTPEGWRQVKKTLAQPLPKPLDKMDMTTLLSSMIQQGCEIYGLPSSELWLECDSGEDVSLYERHFTLQKMING